PRRPFSRPHPIAATPRRPPSSSCSTPATGGSRSASSSQPRVDPVEEPGPALSRALVLLGGHPSLLLEVHLRPVLAQVGENDGHELAEVVLRLIGDGEHEPLGR